MSERPAHEPEDTQPREPFWSLNFPLMVLLGMFVITALFVPVEWIEKLQGLFDREPVNIDTPFADETAELDRKLRAGEPVDQAKLRELEHDLRLRRVMTAGPMTGEDVREVRVMLEDFNAQLEREPNEAGKDALRQMHYRRLDEALPRTSKEAIQAALESFDAQLAAARSRAH